MTGQSNWFTELVHNFNDSADPRTRDWFLVSRPGTLIAIVSFYLYFCLSAGPRYMRNKEPYSLRTTLVIYNFIQIVLSMYLVCEGLTSGWLFEFNYTCQPVDYSDSPLAMRIARGCHLYFICKIIDLLDTVFFVLRKKDSQITFLHLYHHVSMPLGVWIGVRYLAGGHATLLGLMNSFVHVVMYGYYMLAAMGPKVQKYLWWKKYLTLLQMIQFSIIGLHSAQVLFRDCNIQKVWPFLIVIQSIVFVYMFGSFYYTRYIANNVSSKGDDDGELIDSHMSLKSD